MGSNQGGYEVTRLVDLSGKSEGVVMRRRGKDGAYPRQAGGQLSVQGQDSTSREVAFLNVPVKVKVSEGEGESEWWLMNDEKRAGQCRSEEN